MSSTPENTKTSSHAEHHAKAAECCTKAAEEHQSAAKCCSTGDKGKAKEHGNKAEEHHMKAQEHAKHAMAA